MDAVLKYSTIKGFFLKICTAICTANFDRRGKARIEDSRIGHIPEEKTFFISNNQLIPRVTFHPQKNPNKLEPVRST